MTYLEELRQCVRALVRIARALERATGIESEEDRVPPVPQPTPSQYVAARSLAAHQQQSEPIRGPVPQQRPAFEPPPPRNTLCLAQGPVYVGANPVRCGEPKGHEGNHEVAGFAWPQAPAEHDEEAPQTNPHHEPPAATMPPPAPEGGAS